MTSTDLVVVRLVGGPACWHHQALTGVYTRADIEEPPLDDLGTLLVVDGAQLPPRGDDEDEAPRAHYAPAPDGDRYTWHFVGWVPWSPSDPAPESYLPG
ncbi:hypothetical protein [Nocardiopsis sp. HUAS JQ3]|uniref:hypothetical protein n=1 Tax=Nocardiopsis sp. HUAS JQ3 TaxID=3061629 RepID=UPI0023A99892|nr:hypothetical protein [Nocardiopsis sp. HUAS JQ3]WDZ91130.1 hypothetical protein PV789_00710 [Nocardiopsis sp. HUAS JQ3]